MRNFLWSKEKSLQKNGSSDDSSRQFRSPKHHHRPPSSETVLGYIHQNELDWCKDRIRTNRKGKIHINDFITSFKIKSLNWPNHWHGLARHGMAGRCFYMKQRSNRSTKTTHQEWLLAKTTTIITKLHTFNNNNNENVLIVYEEERRVVSIVWVS